MKLIITDTDKIAMPQSDEYKIIRPKEQIKNCIGCFGCWGKTPGKCVIRDGYESMGQNVGHCEELILISECCYGSVSPLIKTVMDRSISYIHPDFVIRKGEMHHKRRYQNRIAVSAYFYGETITKREMDTARALIQANADNYDGEVKRVEFYHTPKEVEVALQ